MIKLLTLSQRLLERADASDEDCRTDDGDIMREADEALKAASKEIEMLRGKAISNAQERNAAQRQVTLLHALLLDDEVVAQAQEVIDERASYGAKVYVSDVLDALRSAFKEPEHA